MTRAEWHALCLTALIALTLTGCAGTDQDGHKTPAKVWPHTVQLPDGREVLCIYQGFDNAGGLSCDWRNAK